MEAADSDQRERLGQRAALALRALLRRIVLDRVPILRALCDLRQRLLGALGLAVEAVDERIHVALERLHAPHALRLQVLLDRHVELRFCERLDEHAGVHGQACARGRRGTLRSRRVRRPAAVRHGAVAWGSRGGSGGGGGGGAPLPSVAVGGI
eukprot:6197252-Prymnesium_polylepis.2